MNHHQMINNPYDEVLAFYCYFVERMGNFHYDPVEDVNWFENLLSWLLSLGYPNSENIHDYYFFVGGSLLSTNVHI